MSGFRPCALLFKKALENSIFKHSARNTWVFKRKYPMDPSNPKSIYYPELNITNYIYEIIDRETLTPDYEMKVILTTYIKGLGDVGDLVSVKADIARYSLLLPKKAVYASPENIAFYEEIKKQRKQKRTFSSPFVSQTITDLTSSLFPLTMSNAKPWTIEPWHIQIALENAGYEILAENSITIPPEPISGPDSEKIGKAFLANIKINNTETAPLICVIFHWGSDIPLGWQENVTKAALPEHEEQVQAALRHRLDTIDMVKKEEEERRRNKLVF